MNRLTLFILAATLLGAPAAAQVGKSSSTEAREVSLSLDGSFDRYGESGGEEFCAGLEFVYASELQLWHLAFDWSLDLYYSYYRSENAGESSKANSAGLDLAKLMLTRWQGKELKALKPYLLTGAELTRLTETNAEGGTAVSTFLSPTLGLGAELKLTGKASLKIEYRTNLAGGTRSVSGLTLGISYAFLGGTDKED